MPFCLLPQIRNESRTIAIGCNCMPLAMDRISLESSLQSVCDKEHLLSSMHGMQSDNDEEHRWRQYRPCSRCASRTRPVLMLLPWILSVTLLVCLVVAINRTPQECVENMFWRELEFGIFYFLFSFHVFFGPPPSLFRSYCPYSLVMDSI